MCDDDSIRCAESWVRGSGGWIHILKYHVVTGCRVKGTGENILDNESVIVIIGGPVSGRDCRFRRAKGLGDLQDVVKNVILILYLPIDP